MTSTSGKSADLPGSPVRRYWNAVGKALSQKTLPLLGTILSAPHVVLSIIAISLGTLFAVSFFSSGLIPLFLFLLGLGTVLGFVLCGLTIELVVRSSAPPALTGTLNQLTMRGLRRTPIKTGLSSFDLCVASYQRTINHLIESIEGIGLESQSIIARYENLTENIAAAIVVRDRDGTITYCSPYTEVLTGYSLNHILNTHGDFFETTTHEEDKEKHQRALNIGLTGEAFQFRYRFFHKTGMEMWAEMRSVPIVHQNGEVHATLAIIFDVTAAVRYQRQVEERNRDMQDFTYMVSHDLKAPLSTIRGMVGLIAEDCFKTQVPAEKLRARLTEPLDHIRSATTRLERLVASVLEYSRISSEEFQSESIKLRSVLQEVRSDLQTQLDESKAVLQIEGYFPMVRGDALKIYQIFSNLLSNSLKYRDPDRPLEISISPVAQTQTRLVTISFKDTGLGIPADKLHTIFRPFHRVHPDRAEGTGIGLACVWKLCEKLGGSVRVQSVENEGTTFLITLRRAEAEAFKKKEPLAEPIVDATVIKTPREKSPAKKSTTKGS